MRPAAKLFWGVVLGEVDLQPYRCPSTRCRIGTYLTHEYRENHGFFVAIEESIQEAGMPSQIEVEMKVESDWEERLQTFFAERGLKYQAPWWHLVAG